jgi:two-component system sensor histidine kinase MtrB
MRRGSRQRKGIKNFVFFWMGGLVLCFVVLTTSLVLSKNKLQSMSSRILLESKSLDVSRRLNTAILAERREDLLWRVIHKNPDEHAKGLELREMGELVQELSRCATSSSEKKLADEIEKRFEGYRVLETSQDPSPIEGMSSLTDNLLRAVQNLGDRNRRQVTQTIEASNRLNARVDLWSLVVTIFAVIMVAFGSIALTNRILQPTLALVNNAKKFGQGDFSAKIKAYRKDELGMLCETFNHMAESICNLQKERMNFIASVAHDLRNPLIVVGMAARRLKRKIPPSSEHTVWLDRIIEQADHIDRLVQDLMDSVKLEMGTLALQKAEVELMSLVRDIHQVQSEVITTHRLVFHGEGVCHVEGDRIRLERVIANIISNSVKYSPEGSTVLLNVKRSGPSVAVTVTDEGVGIPEEEIQELFQPFRRLDRTRHMAKGTGLGLFSARKIVEAHGGTISISSRPGSGTTVLILLPASRNH